MKVPHRHRMRALGGVLLAGALTVALAPTSAAAPAPTAGPGDGLAAAPSTGAEANASAQAVNLDLASGALTLEVSADGGTQAHNDGDDSIYPVSNTPAIDLLAGQDFLTAGALSEVAEADIDGSSYACAGIASPGGTVEVGAQGKACTLTGNGTGGVTIDLAKIPGVGSALSAVASVELTADALTANAYDEGTPGSQHGEGTVAGLKVHVCVLPLPVVGCTLDLTLPVDVPSGVNQDLLQAVIDALVGEDNPLLDQLITLLTNTIADVVRLTSNYQHTEDGVLTVSALHVSLVGDALATADLAKVTVGANTRPAVCDSTFDDVPSSNPFCFDIRWLHIGGITKGYTPTLYKPGWQTSRAWMAAFLFRFANPGDEDPTCSTKPFDDVPISNPFCGDIQWLKQQGIAHGDNGKYYLSRNIGRQAVAAMIYRLTKGGDAPDCTEPPFPDVATTAEFCGAIAWFAEQGISKGYQDGKFHSQRATTRQVMAAWIHRYSTMYPRPTGTT